MATPESHPPKASGKVGFVGLGRMGTVMAVNLVAAGHFVHAYVRRQVQMNALQAQGIVPTMAISDLSDCEIVVSMLPDDGIVRNVFFGRGDGSEGLAGLLRPGTIHLSMSTISTAASAELAEKHRALGQGYVAAPVFGNPDAARARQLFVVMAGEPRLCERCRVLTDNLGRTFLVGADPTLANLIKLMGNMMTATTLEVLGEVIAVLRKCGHDPKPFMDIMTSTMFDGRVHRIYGNKIVSESYVPGLAIPLALKDVRLALAEAEKAGAPMPSVGVVRDRFISAIGRGHADLDWSALGLIAAEEAGL